VLDSTTAQQQLLDHMLSSVRACQIEHVMYLHTLCEQGLNEEFVTSVLQFDDPAVSSTVRQPSLTRTMPFFLISYRYRC
jgi:hypothetical protein